MKTLQGWHDANLNLGKYLEIGDPVDEPMMFYFLEVLPPATYRADLVQIGEPHDCVNGRDTFATLYKPLGSQTWIYAGNCHRGEWQEPKEGRS